MTINLVIPMAGEGSRFRSRGYSFPKPLIQMPDGNPMIKMVIDCLGIKRANWHFIIKAEHENQYRLGQIIPRMVKPWQPHGVSIHTLHETTEGAACTVLTLRNQINNDAPLIVANSDQYWQWHAPRFLNFLESQSKTQAGVVDGAILTFKSFHPKWSFILVKDGFVERVAEKDPISDDATVGVYYWRQGKFFVDSADEMIRLGQRINGEYYVAPTYNKMIQKGRVVIPYSVSEMQGVGTPEDLEKFETKWYIREAIREFYQAKTVGQKEATASD
jgi:NDP-sugar pyrophosphorylase family protein